MICEGCGREVDKLVRHHWYEGGMLYWKTICVQCNSALARITGPNHVMPSWGEQRSYLRTKRGRYMGYYGRRRKYRLERGRMLRRMRGRK